MQPSLRSVLSAGNCPRALRLIHVPAQYSEHPLRKPKVSWIFASPHKHVEAYCVAQDGQNVVFEVAEARSDQHICVLMPVPGVDCLIGCIPLVIEVQMQEPPHAAERTFVRIKVVDNLLQQRIQPPAMSHLFSVHQGPSSSPTSASGQQGNDDSSKHRQETTEWIASHALNPLDCEHYVRGDLR